MVTTPKRCTRCKEVLPRSEFHVAGIGTQGKCKKCVVEYVAEWKREHPEMVKKSRAEYKRNWKKRIPAEIRAAMDRKWKLSGAYGMTPEAYTAIFEAQGGGCAICGAGHGK